MTSQAKLPDLSSEILALQWEQHQHDARYHADVVHMSPADRARHYTLHLAKILGLIVEAMEDVDLEKLDRTLVDLFIITLAAANTFNIALEKHLDIKHDVVNQEGFSDSSAAFGRKLLVPPSDDIEGFVRGLTKHIGKLAKACEAVDHHEAFPSRITLERHFVEVFTLVVSRASVRNIDLARGARERWRLIEAGSLFAKQFAGR